MCRAADEYDGWHLSPAQLVFRWASRLADERQENRRRRMDLADVILHAHSIKLKPERAEAWFRNLGKD